MRDYRLYLEDILEAVKHIERYTKGISATKLKKNKLVIDAVIRNLEIIGEAAKHLPVPIKKKYPHIEWKKISGLRDILAHEYFGVDKDVLLDIIANKVPELKKEISGIIKQAQ
ncbi:MAG: DUF86 domain-containing protein [Candidatus Omnitrophica bacterium]|nr:DUF86 domain-containing protein [Candidatus Omnitrophota bacterium]